jgi:hypothetical protein
MADYTLGNINDLEANPAWKEILRRMKVAESAADEKMEKADIATNREATGERRVARTIPQLPDILRKDVK